MEEKEEVVGGGGAPGGGATAEASAPGSATPIGLNFRLWLAGVGEEAGGVLVSGSQCCCSRQLAAILSIVSGTEVAPLYTKCSLLRRPGIQYTVQN